MRAMQRILLSATLAMAAPALAQTAAPRAQVQAPTPAVAAAAVAVSRAVSGQTLNCPAALNTTPGAVCLISRGTTVVTLRPRISAAVGGAAMTNWQSSANNQISNLIVRSGQTPVYVLLGQLGGDVLVTIDTVAALQSRAQAPAAQAQAPAAQPASAAPQAAAPQPAPAQPAAAPAVALVSAAALREIAPVTPLEGGRYVIRVGERALTFAAGSANATLNGAPQTLEAAPTVQGGSLSVPASAYRLLGCTVTATALQPNQRVIACGGRALTVPLLR